MENKNKKSYTVLILILVIVAIYSYWVGPQRSAVTEKELTLFDLQSQIDSEIQGQFDEADTTVTDIDEALLENAIPEGFDQEDIIKVINKIAEDNIARINSINFSKNTVDKTGIQTVQISLSGSTSEENLESFIYDLESNSRSFIIKTLSVSKTQTELQTRSNFTINLEAYFT